MKGKNRTMRLATCVVMLAVTVVTVFMVRNSMNQVRAGGQMAQQGMQTMMNPSGGSLSTGTQPDGGTEMSEADIAAVQAYLSQFSGEWHVEKYFDGESWKVYKLGMRLAIMAYNYLNDYTYTTGGYDRIVGYDVTTTKEGTTCSKCDIGEMRRETGLDALLAAADSLRCDFCGYEEVIRSSSTPQYEYVPEERHEVHGTDIEYSTPSITVSTSGVDMSGMGGFIFYPELFRVEGEYLINDEFGFALHFDGSYLEYCQRDDNGRYQGYYAYLIS